MIDSRSVVRGRRGVALLALIAAAGCRTASETDIANGDDPIRALEVSVPGTRYTSTYWQTQAERDPALWKRAVAYCEPHRKAPTGARPNCAAVYTAQFEIAGRTPRAPRPRRDASQQVFTP